MHTHMPGRGNKFGDRRSRKFELVPQAPDYRDKVSCLSSASRGDKFGSSKFELVTHSVDTV